MNEFGMLAVMVLGLCFLGAIVNHNAITLDIEMAKTGLQQCVQADKQIIWQKECPK